MYILIHSVPTTKESVMNKMTELKQWLEKNISKEEYKLVFATPAQGRENIEKNLEMYKKCLELVNNERNQTDD